jgi:glycosyltransferase involved in cell wall biosynthesis
MRVVMFLTGAAPFGQAWAEIAGRIADVVTVDVVPRHATGPAPAGRPTPDYPIRRPQLGPKRIAGPAYDRVLTSRIVTTLRRIERERGPIDVLHTHFYPRARLLPAVGRRLGIPYVHTEHSSALTPEGADARRTRRGLAAAAASYGAAAKVIAVSDYLRGCLLDLGLPGPIVVVGNPVDVATFAPCHVPRDPDRIRLISVGRLEADKRPWWLIEALGRVRGQDPRFQLELVGDGPAMDETRSYVHELGLQEAVTFAGRLPHAAVADRVRSCDVHVSASRTETFGLAVAEALAAGIPVVAPRVGGLPELVPPSDGILVDEDPAALASGMLLAGRDPDRFDRAGMAARIRRRFSPDAVAARLEEIYLTAGRS